MIGSVPAQSSPEQDVPSTGVEGIPDGRQLDHEALVVQYQELVERMCWNRFIIV